MIAFSKLQREQIFNCEYEEFEENNILEFEGKKIIVLYGPNGTGKTSFAKILNCEEGCTFSLNYDGQIYTEENSNLFHIIEDQNGRNLIAGETKDFLLGDNIRHEYELKTRIDNGFNELFTKLFNTLKNDFIIKRRNSHIIGFITDAKITEFTSDIANKQSKGSNINRLEFVDYIGRLDTIEVQDYNESKCEFLFSDLDKSDSLVKKVLSIENDTFEQNDSVKYVERSNEAIKILRKFKDVDECIVCDGQICVEEKLDQKTQMKNSIYSELRDSTKEVLNDLLLLVDDSDPFDLKERIVKSIDEGDYSIIENVKSDLGNYLEIISKRVINEFIVFLQETQLQTDMSEYNQLVESRPVLTEEDVIFIETIVNENIDKIIELQRDENNTLRLVLDGAEFLNQDRKKLRLSNGEQNFISLSFELLKAKNSGKEIIVLDDPISSFDSIYKNKIAFSIVKFLERKNQIILTHNVELIRLIEHQKKNCFQLYLFNNTPGEANGFFRLNDNEKDLLLYINKLIYLLRGDLLEEISNERCFLISMIPFMRGYAQMVCNDPVKNRLTSLMHGYNYENQNVTEIFNSLFGDATIFREEHSISAQDIISMDIEDISIFKESTQYKLLEKTLKHTLAYLYLRLSVEKVLVEKFNINTNRHEMLSQIIFKAFPGDNLENKQRRIFLASRKTLLNEFNHFEGNMNIFQPAVDITDTALDKEKRDIISFLNGI